MILKSELKPMDERIRYYPIFMHRPDLENLPDDTLPEGYHFTFYQPGDRDAWIEVEREAGEFRNYQEGLKAWERYYLRHENELCSRMYFIENDRAGKVGTATAFYNVLGPYEEPAHNEPGFGWVHWVGIRPKDQGKGLSKPLVAHTMRRLKELGYKSAVVPTQCTSWVACKVYMDLGFRPDPENVRESYDGYRILRTFWDHPYLKEFTPMPWEEIFRPSPQTSSSL